MLSGSHLLRPFELAHELDRIVDQDRQMLRADVELDAAMEELHERSFMVAAATGEAGRGHGALHRRRLLRAPQPPFGRASVGVLPSGRMDSGRGVYGFASLNPARSPSTAACWASFGFSARARSRAARAPILSPFARRITAVS